MSEGYECDRCGGLNSGTPHTNLALGDGMSRTGPQDQLQSLHFDEDDWESLLDLCRACRNDFRTWWVYGGGDAAEVTGDE